MIPSFFIVQVSFIFQSNIKIDLNKGIHNIVPPHAEVDFSVKFFNIDLLASYNRCWMTIW